LGPGPVQPVGEASAGCRSREYLRHFDSPDAVQHFVFRLADALPAGAMAALDRAGAADRLEAVRKLLHKGYDEQLLADRRIAAIVENALFHSDSARYRLLAWCIMPTHVHVWLASRSPTLGHDHARPEDSVNAIVRPGSTAAT